MEKSHNIESYDAAYVIAILDDELVSRNKSRRWLAEQCGASTSVIGGIFDGRIPPLQLLIKICMALNLTPDYLLGYMEDPEYMGKLRKAPRREDPK